MTNDPIIKIEQLEKSFGDLHVLKGINLEQATTKLPRYTLSVAWLHSVHLLCTRQSVNGANRDHYTNK